VFPKKLPGEIKYDCNKDVFSMKFAYHDVYSMLASALPKPDQNK
jgi:hypothetical protein